MKNYVLRKTVVLLLQPTGSIIIWRQKIIRNEDQDNEPTVPFWSGLIWMLNLSIRSSDECSTYRLCSASKVMEFACSFSCSNITSIAIPEGGLGNDCRSLVGPLDGLFMLFRANFLFMKSHISTVERLLSELISDRCDSDIRKYG
jgi:hypothetical protein